MAAGPFSAQIQRFLRAAGFIPGSTQTLGGVLTTSTTQAGTAADTNELDLWTYSLPANTLAVNGRGVRVTTFGTFGATANTKTLKVYFGATALTASTSTDNGTSWIITFDIIRTSNTAQIAMGTRQDGATARSVAIITPAETLSGAVTIKMAGLNGTAAANDVVFRCAIVELL